MAPGFYTLISAQFISSLADNALLLIAIALVLEQGQSPWLVPLLKAMFTLSYVLLGPWVGRVADSWPKQQVMMLANGIKLLSCLALLASVNPLWAFAFSGLGAALYSPAKYGLITELEPSARLVKANGWIEVSTVCAVILGVMLGGFLISETVRQSALSLYVQDWISADSSLQASLCLMLGLYGLAALINLKIPDSGVRYPALSWQLQVCWRQFWLDQSTLWSDPLGRVSLSVTTLFWGVGATMQLLVLAWAQETLGLSLEQGAYLQGCTALGVVLGAMLAAHWVRLSDSRQVLVLGIVLGALLPMMNWVNNVPLALAMTFSVGAISGFFVVPMNALLQYRGRKLLSSGRSIAIQNFNENASILAMMTAYSLLLSFQCSVQTLTWLLGGGIALGMWVLIRRVRPGV